jgi:hypothetical protein
VAIVFCLMLAALNEISAARSNETIALIIIGSSGSGGGADRPDSANASRD